MRTRLSTAVRRAYALAASQDGASTTESALFAGYGTAHERRLPCQCGGFVTADVNCPAEGLREHQATPRHLLWRLANGL